MDYLPPSARRAREYLQEKHLEVWVPEIEPMITCHHKLRAYRAPTFPLVEVFRQADLVDVSRGFCTFGLSPAAIKQVKVAFPTAGFYRTAARLFAAWIRRHPFNPLPMLKW